jgi:glyoxylase-like metal-dependent hydrolase (beta-lactamase superfamily II)
MSDPVYEVHAIRYAHLEQRSAAENFLDGKGGEEPMPLDYFVWAIVGGEQPIVVDCGFDQAMADKRGRQLLRPVAEGLASVGIDHTEVADVVITHLHNDHAGNAPLFPAARFHLQDSEVAYATGRGMCHEALRHPFELEDVLETVRRVYGGRVVFHDGDAELAPGISLHKVGGHSRGLQVVRVNTARGRVVLASDTAHFYANLEQGRPFPVLCDVGELMDAFDTVNALADSPDHVIPGHDPLVLERFPASGPELDGWAVRLDAEPVTQPAPPIAVTA